MNPDRSINTGRIEAEVHRRVYERTSPDIFKKLKGFIYETSTASLWWILGMDHIRQIVSSHILSRSPGTPPTEPTS